MTEQPTPEQVQGWMPISLSTPEAFRAYKAWRWGNSCWIVAVAFAPTVLAVGIEVMTGFGKGIGLMIGPFWIGAAMNYRAHEGEK